jgi:hypothetical protein
LIFASKSILWPLQWAEMAEIGKKQGIFWMILILTIIFSFYGSREGAWVRIPLLTPCSLLNYYLRYVGSLHVRQIPGADWDQKAPATFHRKKIQKVSKIPPFCVRDCKDPCHQRHRVIMANLPLTKTINTSIVMWYT